MEDKPELPRWDEIPEPQLVEVEREAPVKPPVPVDPDLLPWSPPKKACRPN